MHTYILGQSGTGKSTLLKQTIIDRIHDGHGIFFLDPHGHDTDELLQYIPKSRRADVILFDPSREEVLPFNPLAECSNPALASSILLDTIKDAWGYSDVPTPVMDLYLFMSLFALIEAKETLVGLPYLLSHSSYRAKVLADVKDAAVKSFWQSFNAMTPKEQREQVSSTINKAYMLISDPRVRRSMILRDSAFQCSTVVTNKIFFARLPQGLLSIGRTSLLGSVLLSLMHQACLSRETSVPFHFFLDECHLWSASVVKEMLSGIRKFNVSITLAHQYIDQLDPAYYAAIIGNCAELFVFRTSLDDSSRLERRFGSNRLNFSFHELPDYRARRFPFTARTEDLHVAPITEKIMEASVPDIMEYHRRNLTVEKGVADRALWEFMRGM